MNHPILYHLSPDYDRQEYNHRLHYYVYNLLHPR